MRSPTTFTGPGDFVFAGSNTVIVKKTVPAPTTVFMIANPIKDCEYVIVDGKGDAATNPITIDGNGKLVNGAATRTISVNRGAVTLFYDGAEFFVLGETP